MYIRNTKKDIAKLVDFRRSFEYIKEIKTLTQEYFEQLKSELIEEFESHKVTQEIDAGENSQNISGTLDGIGNLYTFIGFDATSNPDPLEPIRKAFSKIQLTAVIISRDGSSRSTILYPSPDDIFRITPLPWAEGRSWAKGIESGMSGFGKYLSLEEESPKSRSGKGLQAKPKIRGGKFSNTPYISSMIRSFEKNIKNLNDIVI